IAAELEAMDEDMAAVLTPDQQQRWLDLMRELPGQFSRGERGGGPRGPQGGHGGGRGQFHRPQEDMAGPPHEAAPQR
ncbi:MAG: hypothetical protein ACM3VT_03590, partial [Solirubrobacterales bacterium]